MTDTDLLVVADDLTGATDTGHELAARGHDVEVVPAARAGEATGGVVVADTDSRYVAAEDAAERVRAALDARPSRRAYKKVDSTLRGNLVAELDALLDARSLDCLVVAPAFPEAGRRTVGGYHLVDGTPVADTEAGSDPDAPVTTSHVPTLLGEATRPVVHVPLSRVERGPEAVADALRAAADAEPALVVCDAASDAHLDAVAGGARGTDLAVGYAGSAGLARHVRLVGDGRVLGVVGSTHPTTLEALARLPDDRVVELPPERAATDPEAAATAASERVATALETGEYAVVTAARSREAVDAGLEAGRAAGLDDGTVRDRVGRALAGVAAERHADRPLSGLFVTGGAVASRTVDALGARGLSLTGRQVTAGVPLARLRGGDADGLATVTKAGAFGDDATIVNCLAFLARAHE